MLLIVPGELPTMNEIVKVSKAHYGAYANMKRKYTNLVAGHAKGMPVIQRANLCITWYCKSRRKDPDNISTGIKFLLDGLVTAGVLENDGWAQIGEILHTFEIDKKNPRVEVEINAVEEEQK